MDKDEIIEMARQAGFEGCAELTWENVICTEELVAFAKLVAAKATDEANARSNTSWTLMCKKMVEDERDACVFDIRMHIPRVKPDTEEKFFMKRAIDRIEARGKA